VTLLLHGNNKQIEHKVENDLSSNRNIFGNLMGRVTKLDPFKLKIKYATPLSVKWRCHTAAAVTECALW